MRKTVTKRIVSGRSAADGRRDSARKPLVALFGSAAVRPGDALYQEALTMGTMLAAAGFDLMTGGSTGVMEAASRGASEGGAHVIGVTLMPFEARANRWVKEEIPTGSFHERFNWLIGQPDGYVALRGGIGTLTEICQVWQELAFGMLPARPLVLVGPDWRAVFATLKRRLIVKPPHYGAITIVNGIDQARVVLARSLGNVQPVVRKRARRPASRRSASTELGGRGIKPLV